VTGVPATPLAGVTLEIVAVFTVNASDLDHIPPCCTRALPEAEFDATVATTWVSLQLTTVPYVLPSHTAPEPRADPKLEPEIVTCVPGFAVIGETLVMLGGIVTVNAAPLLGTPFTVTTTFPVLAPFGTVTVIAVSLQLNAEPASAPLNVTVLSLCTEPKLLPAILTTAPTEPEFGEILAMLGPVCAHKSPETCQIHSAATHNANRLAQEAPRLVSAATRFLLNWTPELYLSTPPTPRSLRIDTLLLRPCPPCFQGTGVSFSSYVSG